MLNQTLIRIPGSHTHSTKFRDLAGHPSGHITWNQDCKNCLLDLGTGQVYIATVSMAFRDVTSF